MLGIEGDARACGTGCVSLSVHQPSRKKNVFICGQQSKTGAQRSEKRGWEHTALGPAKAEKEVGLVVYACGISTWEIQAGRSGDQGQAQLHCRFETSLGSCLQTNKRRERSAPKLKLYPRAA